MAEQKFIPILFSTPMILAIKEGRKSQTRRVLKLKHKGGFENEITHVHKDGSGTGWVAWFSPNRISAEETAKVYPGEQGFKCPYGQPGDVLWVRETWQKVDTYPEPDCFGKYLYKSMGDTPDSWKPSIFMPKDACRIFLEITGVKVERLQDISEEDAKAEGIEFVTEDGDNSTFKDYLDWTDWFGSPITSFQSLWQKINGVESWNENPFTWVVSFKKIDKPENFK